MNGRFFRIRLVHALTRQPPIFWSSKESVVSVNPDFLITASQSTQISYEGKVGDKYQYVINQFYHIPDNTYITRIENLSRFVVFVSVDTINFAARMQEKA